MVQCLKSSCHCSSWCNAVLRTVVNNMNSYVKITCGIDTNECKIHRELFMPFLLMKFQIMIYQLTSVWNVKQQVVRKGRRTWILFYRIKVELRMPTWGLCPTDPWIIKLILARSALPDLWTHSAPYLFELKEKFSQISHKISWDLR